LFSLAKRIEAIRGTYGVQKRRDGKQGSLFWFEIPYRPDVISAKLTRQSMMLAMGSLLESNPIGDQQLRFPEDIAFDPLPTTVVSNILNTVVNDAAVLPIDTERINVTSPVSPLSLQTNVVNSSPPKPQGLQILLVDDSPTIVKMVSMMLRHQGHTVKIAENGQVAVESFEKQWKLHNKGFDVMLMDLQMPVMDGVEATKRIRGLESDCSYIYTTPQYLIAMSANSDDETMEEILQAGADDFMAKPFVMDLFLQKVTSRLASSSAIYDE